MKARKSAPSSATAEVRTRATARVRLNPSELLEHQRGCVIPYDGYDLSEEWQEVPLEVAERWLARMGKGHGMPPLEIDVPDR